ncbi:MAG: GNAT family N-acetyltransferase [Chloroflexota bacterium]|nr:GNAT family N-acetyltransferase [Chloroflexota bacterium]
MAENTSKSGKDLSSTGYVQLREVTEADLPFFFEFQLDPEANHMAAFTARDPADRDAFMRHWAKILADDSIVKRTILYNGQVVGSMVRFDQDGKPEIGYWIGRDYWGKGIATRALSAFLEVVTERPLYAAAAWDNAASIRVLEKCGFTLKGYGTWFSNARGGEIKEARLELK